MRTRIKICCMASQEEVELAIRAGADAVGLIGKTAQPSSPRAIDDHAVTALAASVPPPIATFMLTSERSAAGIAQHVRAAGACTVQICSHLTAQESERLAELLPTTRRVQVIHVEDKGALELIAPYAPFVHAFLLDSGKPGLPTPVYGGTGLTHDWSVSAEFVKRSPRPVFLAGGLTASNVGEAIERIRPFAVDLCTGVRTDGRLDPEKLAAFMTAVRAADADFAACDAQRD
jgi:phosphoribosylanthranilate isomerase